MSKKILITCIGSRGDVQPFLSLALHLRSTYSHTCIIAAHPEFQQWIEAAGFEFAVIGESMVENVMGDEGKQMANASVWEVLGRAKRFFGRMGTVW